MTKPVKLSRAQVKKALEVLPLERVLLGAAESGAPRLTAKQRAFAEAIAMGETKAGAYRKVYKSKGKPNTAAREGHKLASDPKIAATAEAIKAGNGLHESQTPAELRAWTIRQLEQHAQDESFPPAQRIKCLELLGKITEVALFTERREVVQTVASHDLRAKLMAQIRAAMKDGAVDVEAKEAGSLMAEIKAKPAQEDGDETGSGIENPDAADPPPADPLNAASDTPDIVHSIPHSQSASQTEAHLPEFKGENSVSPTITPVTVEKAL